MGDFVMRPDDEMTHKPDASVSFNESVYTNGFNSASPVGGWMRLGNRVNEGYAELSVCLYLPDGRIACQFQRPNITSNERFDAGGLSYAVIEPLKKVSMTFDGELMIVKDPNALRDPKTLFADGPRDRWHRGDLRTCHRCGSVLQSGTSAARPEEASAGIGKADPLRPGGRGRPVGASRRGDDDCRCD